MSGSALREARTRCRPRAVERMLEQFQPVGANGGFLLVPGSVAATDEESGQQQGYADHGAAGIGRQRAGSRGVEQAKEVREGQGPHLRITRGGKRIEKDGVRFGKSGGGERREEFGKIGEMELPNDLAGAVLKSDACWRRASRICGTPYLWSCLQQGSEVGFISVQVAKSLPIREGEAERLGGMVEAVKDNSGRQQARSAEEGKSIRSRAEADIPNDKIPGVAGQSAGEVQLADIERVRFRGWPKAWMHRLRIALGTQAVGAVGELDELIGVCGHGK